MRNVLNRFTRPLATVAAGLALAAAGLCGTAHTADDGTVPGADPDRVSTMCYSHVNEETDETLHLIWQGGPYPHPRKDGSVFENRDDNPLPRHENGYYHEFTVPTPGLDHRGKQRIVTGGELADRVEDYYTADHYDTFDLIDYGC